MTDQFENEDTQNTDVMEQILEKLTELCEIQKQQGEELSEQGDQINDILDRLYKVEAHVVLIHEQQVNNSKTMAEMKFTCEQRPFKCRARPSDTPIASDVIEAPGT